MAKVIIAILYIAAILVIGFLAGRNVKTADEFAVANRNIPYWTNVFSMSSAWIGAGSTLGCASMCYAYGVSGFYLAIGVSIGAILASVVFSGKIREENVSTIPELVRKHVGAKCANAIALLSIFSVFSVVASQIRSLGTILQMFVPSLSLLTAIIIMTVVMLIYTVVGGMVAATKTDKLNIGLMVLSVMIILPIVALVKAGGLSNIVETLRTSDPAKLQFGKTVGWGTMISSGLYFGTSGMVNSENFLRVCGAKNAKEACQWLYFGYLAAIKTQNGAAMSVGRISTFLDIYIQRDLDKGILTESQAQELIDHMVMKFRMVKFARIPSYNQLFSGDPVWATLEVGGIGMDGRSMVTKNCYRFLHTLENMGPAPEPNLTVLYSSALPEAFKKYAAKVSVNTSSVQYENDDVMKPVWGDDYSICCCVSATQTGKEMQFFGARANLAKCLLYAINGGVDEKSHEQCGPNYAPITSEYLTYDEVLPKYVQMLDWLAGLYVNVLNLIQYMHDKYYYEEAEMALIDTDVRRTFATGIAGFSHVIDSLSAIKYAKVKVVRDENGLATGFETEGDFPKYGNDDDRADEIGVWLLKTFLEMIKKRHTYRNSEATTSILTITSNVVYGKYTGALPDGRAAFTPFAPGATPSYGAEQNGLLASLNSVAKLPYHWALDGISNTQTINPEALGHSEGERVENLVQVLDGYFDQGAHHLNVNVFGKEKLLDAMEHPEKEEYANFTIRVSGYAVKFIDLTREQQLDVLARTCHGAL